jgi:hypothetical protein
MRVIADGIPDLLDFRGLEDGGTVIVSANPRIADVNIPEASKDSLSRWERRDLKSTSG